VSASKRGRKRRAGRRKETAPLHTTCYVCGITSAYPAGAFRRDRERWVCRNVQLCTDRVFNPPVPLMVRSTKPYTLADISTGTSARFWKWGKSGSKQMPEVPGA
jgi:hypothetical protein